MNREDWEGYEHISDTTLKLWELITPHLICQDDTVWHSETETLMDAIEELVKGDLK